MTQNRAALAVVCENWQLPKEDTSTFRTFPLPEWNKSLGFWPNTVALLREIQKVGQITNQLDR